MPYTDPFAQRPPMLPSPTFAQPAAPAVRPPTEDQGLNTLVQLLTQIFAGQAAGQHEQTQLQRDVLVPKHETNLTSSEDWRNMFPGAGADSGMHSWDQPGWTGASPGAVAAARPPMPAAPPTAAPFDINTAAITPMDAFGAPALPLAEQRRRNMQIAKPGGLNAFRWPGV